ncbi:glycoside hydrolase [Dendryphion nanum]|uniref:Glycoside hydrolase n=1 Tax=Dendryphion nanum TaxID=256645 RepID=A0A9P9E4J9_9PLEO|nr:glycoside hydrolase [Dendryphion nanum]
MSKFFSTAAILATLLSTVTGHTAVKDITVNGKTYPGFRGASKAEAKANSPAWPTNQGWGFQPVYGEKINHPDIIAHIGATPSTFAVDVPAGKDVTFNWHHDGSCGAGEVGWDCSHHGWTSVWLAKVPNNQEWSSVDKTQLNFFKISESALIDYRSGRYSTNGATGKESVGYWGTDKIFYDQGNKQTVTIPKDLPNGKYVLRTEVTSIHNQGQKSAQLWPQAFSINLTGGNDNKPVPQGQKGTEIYKTSDALLNWNIYWHEGGKTFASAPGSALASVASAKSTRRHARDFA